MTPADIRQWQDQRAQHLAAQREAELWRRQVERELLA